MLTLPIQKKWYQMIVSGVKTEEYRTIKHYYRKRFQSIGLLDCQGNPTDSSAVIQLRNGYSSTSPTAIVRVTLSIKSGNIEWGAVHGQSYYCLTICSVIHHYERRWIN